ncbi:MAG: SufD family Fe-S cluster assembly protein [Erythrobacter sp.]|jgi:Fe-S cluster assembly protein SufD|nr:SufD family Fe-S cluster assembly protein [Erythrobacter sp.]
MSESVLLPTRRDEAWRYSDTDALAGVDLGTFERWEDIELAPGEARRELVRIEDDDTLALRRLRVRIGEGARFDLFAIVAGARLGRLEIVATLAKDAHFEFGGVTLGGGETTREIVTRVAHEAPEATSNQTVRSVHWGRGTGNFLGRIDVASGAQKTDAAQSFKGLLLENGASANAVPQLEIYADDVKCAHGATVGRLDEAARFYMAARGLPPEAARALLVRAFLADAFVELDDADAQETMLEAALAMLETIS